MDTRRCEHGNHIGYCADCELAPVLALFDDMKQIASHLAADDLRVTRLIQKLDLCRLKVIAFNEFPAGQNVGAK